MNEFTPKIIGLPDTKKKQEIIKIYSGMCDIATVLVTNLQYYLSSPHFEINELFDFLKSKEPKGWLYSKFIEYHGLTFPGMNLDKIIQFELVDIPKEYLQDTIRLREELLSFVSKTKEVAFYFPLINLFEDSDDANCRDFGISFQYEYEEEVCSTPEFDLALYNHVRKFTKSESENEVLKAIENVVNAMNDLILLGVWRNDRQRWGVDLDNLIRTIVFTLKSEKPLSVHADLPRFKGFEKFFEKSVRQVTGRPEDILNCEKITPDQSEEIPEDYHQTEDPETEPTEVITEEIFQTE